MCQMDKGWEITGGWSESTSRTGVSPSLLRKSDGCVLASASKFMIMGRVNKHVTRCRTYYYTISKMSLPHSKSNATACRKS